MKLSAKKKKTTKKNKEEKKDLTYTINEDALEKLTLASSKIFYQNVKNFLLMQLSVVNAFLESFEKTEKEIEKERRTIKKKK